MNIELKPAEMKDANLLFQWRNDFETKKASIDMNDVTVQQHKQWLTMAISDPDNHLFIAWQQIEKNGLQAVGTVRANYDGNNTYELSWTVAPEVRGQGIGKVIVGMLADKYSNGNIKAKVKSYNEGSMKIAESVGMECVDKIYHYYKEAKNE